MKRARGALVQVSFLGLAVAFACGGPAEQGNTGAECFRDRDCEPGLVCVKLEGQSGRVCSSDVTGLVSQVPGPEAPGPDEGAGGALSGAGGAPAPTGGAPGTPSGGAPATPAGGAPALPSGGAGGEPAPVLGGAGGA